MLTKKWIPWLFVEIMKTKTQRNGGGSTSGTRGTREAETRRDKEASLSRTYNVLARNTCFQHVIKTTNQRREVSIHLSKKKKSPLWREWGRCLWRKDGNLRALPLLGKIWETNYYHFIFKTFKSWLIKKIYSETNFWYIHFDIYILVRPPAHLLSTWNIKRLETTIKGALQDTNHGKVDYEARRLWREN